MSHPTVRSPRSPVAVALRGGFPLLAVVTVLAFPGAPATAQSSLLVPQQVFDGETTPRGMGGAGIRGDDPGCRSRR